MTALTEDEWIMVKLARLNWFFERPAFGTSSKYMPKVGTPEWEEEAREETELIEELDKIATQRGYSSIGRLHIALLTDRVEEFEKMIDTEDEIT